MNDLNIVFEDSDLIIVDKPAGLLMHPSWLDRAETDTLASRVKRHLRNQGDDRKVHTIHRLDRPTSGLVLIAKSDDVARQLAAQFAEKTVNKSYWAICRGFSDEQALIDYPLKEEHDKIADKFADDEKEAQPAQTSYRRLGICEVGEPVSRYAKSRFSWLECVPLTGRKHQIRRHFKHTRHPLLGDTRHGDRHINKVWNESFGFKGLALRAVQLEFIHPRNQKAVQMQVGANEDWQAWLSFFGWYQASA